MKRIFQPILAHFLNKYLTKYMNGVTTKNIESSVWGGTIEIKNVSFKENAFEDLQLPLKIVFSHIGEFSLNVDWYKLSSKPVEITIKDVYLTVSATGKNQWDLNIQ